jgi:hypothetical protein
MQPETCVDVPQFWERGYLLIRHVFSGNEIQEFRRHAFEKRGRKGDLLCDQDLRKVVLDDRVLSIAEQILGDTPVYYGDSACNLGDATYFFHKDNADRSDPNAPDWKGKYTQIRFGVYLQDHAWHSGGLRVIPESHNSVSNPTSRGVNIRSRVGDMVVWSLRTDHTGGALVMPILPWLYIEPRESGALKHRYLVPIKSPVSMRVPRLLLADVGPERAALFFSLGLEDAHLERYLKYLCTRKYMVDCWKESVYGPDTWDAFKGKKIKVIDMGEKIRQGLAEGDTSLGANEFYAAIPY